MNGPAWWRQLRGAANGGRRTNTPLLPNVIFSGVFCGLVALAFAIVDENCRHWFVIPVALCGALIGNDAITWIRGKVDLFDPIGVVGAFGLYFFFLTPFLHVHLDSWMRNVEHPPDWRPWLGQMAIINCIVLVFYLAGRQWRPLRIAKLGGAQKRSSKYLSVYLLVLLFVSFVVQVYVYVQVGGIAGYVGAFTEARGAFDGMGWIFMISESFPVLAIIGYAIVARSKPALRAPSVLVIVVIALLGLSLLFGGLRGSRSNTVWKLIWCVGIIHLQIRPLSRAGALVGVGGLVCFMYMYGFYKGAGLDGLKAFESREQRIELENRTNRTLETSLLGDLGRADVQALILYRLSEGDSRYNYAYGKTYLAALSMLVPRQLRGESQSGKVNYGTVALVGGAAYDIGRRSSRVYGLAGEGMLNAGPLITPLLFFAWGRFVGLGATYARALHRSDPRLLLTPFVTVLACLLLSSDLDNVIFFTVKNGFIPFLLLLLGSRRVRLPNLNTLVHTPVRFTTR